MDETPEGELTPYMRGVLEQLERDGIEKARLLFERHAIAPELVDFTASWIAQKDAEAGNAAAIQLAADRKALAEERLAVEAERRASAEERKANELVRVAAAADRRRGRVGFWIGIAGFGIAVASLVKDVAAWLWPHP